MKTLKLLGAALAAVTMAFTAQAAKTAKAVFADGGKTLRFVYDEADYGTKDVNWFSVAEARSQIPSAKPPWHVCRGTVTKVVFDSTFAAYQPRHCGCWFLNFEALKTVEGMANLDTSVATDLQFMFGNCTALTALDVSGFSTSMVTNMCCLFAACWSLDSLDVSGFDTSKVRGMTGMFFSCSSLAAIYASDAFVTDLVTESADMFSDCKNLVGGKGTVYDSTKTDKTYARIDKAGQPGYFTRAPTAKVVVEDGGKTLRFVYDGKDYGTKDAAWFSVADAESRSPNSYPPWYAINAELTKVVFDVSFAAYQPKHCGDWFLNCQNLVKIERLDNLDTSQATSLVFMFYGCSRLTSLDLSGFDTAKVADMSYMFSGCTALKMIIASSTFVTSAVTSSGSMFNGCTVLVGGAGTKYNSAKTDATYARIDGGPSAPGYFTRGKTASAADDLNGDGRADIVMTIDETGHPADGSTGVWLIQSNQTAVWGDLSQRNAGWDILGLGATAPNKATKDVYLVSPDNVVGAWTTDASGKVTGWKTVDSFNSSTTVRGLGDFNGDGQSDLLLVNDNGAVGCYFTSGAKTGWNYFQSLGDEWQICGIGDLNGDGRDDLVLKHDAGFAGSWLTQADGTMAWADLDTLPAGYAIVGCGDFDGDGTDDVLLRKGNYYGAWLVQDGQARDWMGLGDLGGVTVEQIADFDGDGRDDIRIRTANGDLGAELVKGADNLKWAYYGSVGYEWLTEPLGLK